MRSFGYKSLNKKLGWIFLSSFRWYKPSGIWQYMSPVVPISLEHKFLEEMCYSEARNWLNIIIDPKIQKLLLLCFRTPQAVLDINPDLDLFKLNGEKVIKRVEIIPSLDGTSRSFIMISSDKVLSNLLLSSTKGVMDRTFKVYWTVVWICFTFSNFCRYVLCCLNNFLL